MNHFNRNLSLMTPGIRILSVSSGKTKCINGKICSFSVVRQPADPTLTSNTFEGCYTTQEKVHLMYELTVSSDVCHLGFIRNHFLLDLTVFYSCRSETHRQSTTLLQTTDRSERLFSAHKTQRKQIRNISLTRWRSFVCNERK